MEEFGGEVFVKVMSDEQLELLRLQISAYIVLSEQLAHMHNSLLTSQQHLLSGLKFGSNNCYDPYNYGLKMTSSRKRWSPTPDQLQMLERVFDEANGAPNKHSIKTVTEQLAKFGEISETKVYNWFQNRRARSKRKLPLSDPDTNVEPPPRFEAQVHGQPLDSDDDTFVFLNLEDLVSLPENASVNELD